MKLLLVYGTTEGQTQKIARFVADYLARQGHQTEVINAIDATVAADPRDVDAVIIAASIHVGRYQSAIIHFVRDHLAVIDERPNAFLSVSLAAARIGSADRHWLGRAAAAHQLVLSNSSRDSKQLVWHAHLCFGVIAILMYSASWFTGRDSAYRSLVGRANRWLHWQDMLCFKRAGVRYYDWGGMFQDESTADRAGINQFKRMFGGRPVLAYECTVPVSARGRLWLVLRDVRRGLCQCLQTGR